MNSNEKYKKVCTWMRVAMTALFTLHFSLFTSFAQDIRIVKGSCTPVFEGDGEAEARSETMRRLPAINTNWDANRIYHQLVILVSFADTDFLDENPQEAYDKMLNQEGYNRRQGPGCLADYFHTQSGGLFNVQFDVYGPYKVDSKAQPYDNPTSSTHNYGREQMRAATYLFLEDHPDIDFSQYDWNNNGKINQVIYVFAGYCGNLSSTKSYGYLWPNTSSFTNITTHDGKVIANYSASAELWTNDQSCGFGTICHEYTHSLGLPDIYPISNSAGYSVLDEWDLMDGGNFTNYGWCPPNYTALEKKLLGWLTPVELKEPKTISNLTTVENGGKAYMVKNTNNEYYLLENRQWNGWDIGAPGKGLVIYHVDYNSSSWNNNNVNNNKDAYKFHLMAADNMDYDAWDDYLLGSGASSQYASSGRMNNLHLSGAPYPFLSTDAIVNNELTDTSVPAAKVYNANAGGSLFMSKPITDIVQNDDGTVSFLFMGGDSIPNGISDNTQSTDSQPATLFDLQGRRIHGKPARGLVISNGRIHRVQ